MRKVVSLATRLCSFDAAAKSVVETLEVTLSTKRVERLTERIGLECVVQRAAEITRWRGLPLAQKLVAPPGVKAPAMVCVSADGGRLQRCDLPAGTKSQWCETKVGVLLELEPTTHVADPCPQVPDKFLDLVQMEQVTREIKGTVPTGSLFASRETSSEVAVAASSPSAASTSIAVTTAREAVVAKPPTVLGREVTASLSDSPAFGHQLAARAWSLGFAGATLKAFVADGSSTNWGIWDRNFKHQAYVPILDFIHALTYVYSAALAGRSREAGGPIYVRWITWIWQGEVSRVIDELAQRCQELGPPPDAVPDSDPRHLTATTLTYLTNQRSRMAYPEYRRQGLPITSSHVESTVKQINQRVKGTEKFWTESGAEALLQLRADQLSDTAPLDHHWTQRPRQATGTRTHTRSVQPSA